MTTEKLILRSIERGITLRDWDHLTYGMIIGIITQYDNEYYERDDNTDTVMEAGQAQFDRF